MPIIAELWRAKRASKAPWVRNIGNLSSRENLVMTSAYERTSVRPYVRTDYWGGVGAYQPNGGAVESQECIART